MVKLTTIARVTDGLPLAEVLDDGRDAKDAEYYKQQVKASFKNSSTKRTDGHHHHHHPDHIHVEETKDAQKKHGRANGHEKEA